MSQEIMNNQKEDSFFGKNGTMQGAFNMANAIGQMKSDNAVDRLDGIIKVAGAIVAMCCA